MPKTKYIIFTAGVHLASAAKLRQIITDCVNQKYDELYFLISSGGGDVFEGLSLATYINALPMKTTMHNIGQVDSVATAIFASGKERIASKNSSFMFHGVTMNLEKCSLVESQLKEIYNNVKKLKEDIAKAISSFSGIKLSDIDSLMVDGGNTLTAEEAKTRGFISNIAEPSIPNNADIISVGNV